MRCDTTVTQPRICVALLNHATPPAPMIFTTRIFSLLRLMSHRVFAYRSTSIKSRTTPAYSSCILNHAPLRVTIDLWLNSLLPSSSSSLLVHYSGLFVVFIQKKKIRHVLLRSSFHASSPSLFQRAPAPHTHLTTDYCHIKISYFQLQAAPAPAPAPCPHVTQLIARIIPYTFLLATPLLSYNYGSTNLVWLNDSPQPQRSPAAPQSRPSWRGALPSPADACASRAGPPASRHQTPAPPPAPAPSAGRRALSSGSMGCQQTHLAADYHGFSTLPPPPRPLSPTPRPPSENPASVASTLQRMGRPRAPGSAQREVWKACSQTSSVATLGSMPSTPSPTAATGSL